LRKSPSTFLKLTQTPNTVWNYSLESWISWLTPSASFYLHFPVLTSSIEQSTWWGWPADVDLAWLGLADDEVMARGPRWLHAQSVEGGGSPWWRGDTRPR
jgi:hypothetical protein